MELRAVHCAKNVVGIKWECTEQRMWLELRGVHCTKNVVGIKGIALYKECGWN